LQYLSEINSNRFYIFVTHLTKHSVMKLYLFLIFNALLGTQLASANEKPLFYGQQPNLAIDQQGTLRMVYGEEDRIYVVTSTDEGKNFSIPVLVAKITDMHLGMSRGPQIASSANYSMVTAIDKSGTIHSYLLNHRQNKWNKSANVNDVKGSAVEGLMALTADKEDNFYAAWLDIRLEKKNNIFFTSRKAGSEKWNPNTLVYKSPDQHVCECCKPNITFNNNRLVISFRNWLMGSRDIYYSISLNKGKTFGKALKSGTGTWKLDACPMDGGGLAITGEGQVAAAWQRGGEVYFAVAGHPEQKIGAGRGVSLAQAKDRTMIAFQDNKSIKVYDSVSKAVSTLGEGSSAKIYLLPNRKGLCVWEDNKSIYSRIL
jgi:hypothetical protein